MKSRLCLLCLGTILLIGLLSTAAYAGPCRVVHDLITPDGPYYVMPNGSFVKLQGNWTNHACSLIRSNGVRNSRGFTTCNEYTRIQCGCDAASRSNATCANFLRSKGYR